MQKHLLTVEDLHKGFPLGGKIIAAEIVREPLSSKLVLFHEPLDRIVFEYAYRYKFATNLEEIEHDVIEVLVPVVNSIYGAKELCGYLYSVGCRYVAGTKSL